MTLDLEDPDGGKEKLGQICAVFTVQPKNFKDRQEVLVKCILFALFYLSRPTLVPHMCGFGSQQVTCKLI